MVYSLILGAVALLGGGWFASSLVASMADPIGLLLAAASSIVVFVNTVDRGYISDYFSSKEGEYTGAGLIGAGVFYLVFVVTQAVITGLSPLAGVLVVALGVAVFFFGPGILFDLADLLFRGE